MHCNTACCVCLDCRYRPCHVIALTRLVADLTSSEAAVLPKTRLISPSLFCSSATMGKTTDVNAVARALRVARATFARRTGDLRSMIKHRIPGCKKAKGQLRKLEARLKELGGELSEEVSSEGSLLGVTSSEESGEASSDEAPVKKEEDDEKPEAAAEGNKGHGVAKPGGEGKPKAASKKPARRSKEAFPFIPPGDPAPNHRGRPTPKAFFTRGFQRTTPSFATLARCCAAALTARAKPTTPLAPGGRADKRTCPKRSVCRAYSLPLSVVSRALTNTPFGGSTMPLAENLVM